MNILCKINLHNWQHQTRATPGTIANSILFHVKECRTCKEGKIRIGKIWGTKYIPFANFFLICDKTEKELFESATVSNCIEQFGRWFRNDIK